MNEDILLQLKMQVDVITAALIGLKNESNRDSLYFPIKDVINQSDALSRMLHNLHFMSTIDDRDTE